MNARLLDGRLLAQQVRAEVALAVTDLAALGIRPGLAVMLAGDDGASAIYVKNKEKAAAEVGIAGLVIRFPSSVQLPELLACVDRLNADRAVHGILIQLPLPPTISGAQVRQLLERVLPAKDVDGFHPENLGHLAAGQPRMVACTPSGCMRLLQSGDVAVAGRHAVVVGRSTIVGRPMALLLLAADATVTLCHSKTPDLAEHVRRADIVVAAVGRERLVRGTWIKPGAAVIDVGMNRDVQGKLCGDVHFDEVVQVAGAITPVPGGVGPMTIACLLENVCRAARPQL